MLKRLGKVLFVLLAALGAITGGLLAWATSESGSSFISSRVRQAIQRQTGAEVSFRDIDIELFPPRLALREIVAEGPEGRVSCKVSEAELAPDPLSLFAGELVIDELYLGSPRCRVRLDGEDASAIRERLEDAEPGDEGHLDLSVIPEFEVFALSDGRLDVEIDDAEGIGRIDAEITGLGLDVTGTPPGMEIRGLVEAIDGSWKRGKDSVEETLRSLKFRAAVCPDSIDVRHLLADVAGADLRLRDGHVPFPLWPRGPDVADFAIEVPLPLLERLPLELPEMSGTAGFQGQVSLRRGDDDEVGVTGRGRVELQDAVIDELRLGDLEGLVSLGPRGVAFSETDLHTADGRLRLEGNVELDEKLTARLDANLHEIELGRLLESLTVPGSYVTQRMNGTANLRGTLSPMRLDGRIDVDVTDHTTRDGPFRSGRSEVVLHIPRGSVRGKVHIKERSFSASGLDVRLPRSRVLVEMRFAYEMRRGWSLQASSDDLELGDIGSIAGLPVSGHGPVNCRIRDPSYGDPRISGSVAFDDLVIGEYRLGHAASGVRFSGYDLVLERIEAHTGSSLYNAPELRITFGGRDEMRLETRLMAERVAVQDLARIFRVDTSRWGSPRGVLSGRAAVDYRLRSDDLGVEVDAVHDGMTIFGERFGPDAVRLDWKNEQLTVSELGLTKGRGTISVTGAMMPDRSLNFVGVASEVDLSSFEHPALRDLELQADAQLFAVIGGTLDHPTGWAEARLGETEMHGLSYGPTHVELELDDTQVTGRGKLAGEMLHLEHLDFDLENETFLVEGFAYDLDLIEALDIDTGARKVAAEITGELALSGRLADRPGLEGRIGVQRIELAIGDYRIRNKRPIEIAVKRDRFHLSRTRFIGPRLAFDLRGRAGLSKVDLDIDGLADLRIVDELFDSIHSAEGRLRIDAHVSGRWTNPRFRGHASLEDGSLGVRGFPHRIEEIEGRVELGAEVFRFEDFSARSAGGGIEIDGKLTLDGLEVDDYRFRCRLDGFDLAPLPDLRFQASTVREGLLLRPSDEVSLGGGPKRELPTITGDVEISDLEYTQDIRMIEVSDLSIDRLAGKRTGPSTPRVYEEKNDLFAFDIRLHGSQNLRVRNNLIDADLRIDDVENPLRLIGSNQIFGFRGRLLATRGQVRFAGKRFELRYGAVTWTDPLQLTNPDFRVTADGQVRDWKVAITAVGSVEEYEIRLSSQPFLSDEDLVFLLLTGMTRAEHRRYGSTGLGGIGAPLLDQIGPGGELIPLELRIYTEYSERAGTDTTRISLGRSLPGMEDVWISLSSSVGQERDVKANLEYRIDEHFSLSADYENTQENAVGNIGVDLKYRLEFPL